MECVKDLKFFVLTTETKLRERTNNMMKFGLPEESTLRPLSHREKLATVQTHTLCRLGLYKTILVGYTPSPNRKLSSLI